jgi:chromate reductase
MRRRHDGVILLAQADQAFDSGGRLASADLRARLDRTVTSFMELVEAAKNYPCAKKAWVEFLGEHPNPLIDRVE